MADFDPSAPSSPEDGPQREQRVELRRKVSLKFKEFQGFINEYSENVSTGGMFIRTASPQPPGAVFDFELTLGEDFKLIQGIGEVVWARDEDEGFDRPAGMGVRFLTLDPESRKLVDRIVSERLAREALHGATGAPAKPTPDPGREEWRLDAPAPAPRGPGPDGVSPPSGPEEPWWPGESVPEGAQAPSGFEPPPAPQTPPPVPDEAPEATLEAEAPDFPRPPGPSPYAYSRSYAGSGVARPGRRGPRPLLLVLVAAVVLVGAVAGLLSLFPDVAVRLLGGGEADGEAGVVATRAPGGPEAGGGARAPEVAPTGAGGAEAEPGGPTEGEGGESGGGELGFFEEPAGDGPTRKGEDGSPGELPSAPAPDPAPAPEPEPQVPEPPPASPPESPETVPAPVPPSRAEEAPPEPPPQPAPSPEPAPAGFSRVLNVVWEARGDELLVTVHLDGTLREWEYSVTRVGAPPPRDLVRIRGIDRPFPRPTIPVGHPLLERVRLGFHPGERENELHLVLDLPREMVGVDRSEAVGSELRLYVSPMGGRQPPTP